MKTLLTENADLFWQVLGRTVEVLAIGCLLSAALCAIFIK